MKRLGKQKAAELEEKAPGITLSGWLNLNFTHVTLYENIFEGGKRLQVPKHNVELTMALLSTDNVADFAKVALHWAPAGTIVDKVPDTFFQEKLLLVRQLLTKELVTNPDNKLALRYLTILERRDQSRWAMRQKAMEIKATASKSEGGDGGNSEKQTVKLQFEIVDT